LRHTATTSRTDAVRQEIRLSSGRMTSSKRPDSCCASSVTRAWKRRPFLSTSTMSPAAMPFDVTRFGASRAATGVAGTSISAGWTSGMSAKLGIRPDGPLVERDREQQIEQIGDLARVAARALLDPPQAILRGVGVDLELLGGAVDLQVGVGERLDRRRQDAAARAVVLEELAHARVHQPLRGVVDAQRQVAERRQPRQRDDAAAVAGDALARAGLASALQGLPRSDRDERALREAADAALGELGVAEYADRLPGELAKIADGKVELMGDPVTTDDEGGAIEPSSEENPEAPANGIPPKE
jgi:hypothetical protein